MRLKGGDPFVFGRGGEEALALAAAGIPFEVVPGVSSAIAAPALAGIPVTHRGLSSGFVVVSGHAEDAYRPVLESLAPHSATVVVMMGLGRIDAIAELLHRARLVRDDAGGGHIWRVARRVGRVDDVPARSPAAAPAARARRESPRESERGWGPGEHREQRTDARCALRRRSSIGDVGDGSARFSSAQAEADEAAAGGQ